MQILDDAVEAAYAVFAYAVHADDKQTCLDELRDALAPFVVATGGRPVASQQPDYDIGQQFIDLDADHPSPNAYGLDEDEEVRFPRPGRSRPDTGKVMGLNKDGSILCMCDRTKFARSIRPEELERKVVGPRGGVSWEPVVPT